MKKIIIALCLTVFSATTATAWPGHGWGGRHHFHQPAVITHHYRPVHIVKKYHHDNELGSFFAGLVGSAIGSYVVSSTYQQPSYNMVPAVKTQCFLLVSEKRNKSVKRCIEIDDGFNQNDIYKILYVD